LAKRWGNVVYMIVKVVFIFSILFIPATCYSSEYQKITSIKGIILLCEGLTEAECFDTLIIQEANTSRIKLLFRSNLRAILDERKLQSSGMTEIESNKEIGKLLGASHLLLYKTLLTKGDMGSTRLSCDFKLININTSEIEYGTTTFDDTNIKQRGIDVLNSTRGFFIILGQFREKSGNN
jgi:hypothetical protein